MKSLLYFFLILPQSLTEQKLFPPEFLTVGNSKLFLLIHTSHLNTFETAYHFNTNTAENIAFLVIFTVSSSILFCKGGALTIGRDISHIVCLWEHLLGNTYNLTSQSFKAAYFNNYPKISCFSVLFTFT